MWTLYESICLGSTELTMIIFESSYATITHLTLLGFHGHFLQVEVQVINDV